jgi:DNA-binding LacI/PurR family transcriptional regulator
VPGLERPFFGGIAKAHPAASGIREYSLIIASSEEYPAWERRGVESLIVRRIEAIVLMSVQTSADRWRLFMVWLRLLFPNDVIDRNFPGLEAKKWGLFHIQNGISNLFEGGSRSLTA